MPRPSESTEPIERRRHHLRRVFAIGAIAAVALVLALVERDPPAGREPPAPRTKVAAPVPGDATPSTTESPPSREPTSTRDTAEVEDLATQLRVDLLPLLQGSELDALVATATRQVEHDADRLDRFRAKSDGSYEAMAKEARLDSLVEVARIARESVLEGRYLLATASSAGRMRHPRGLVLQTMGCTADGEAAVAIVVRPPERASRLAELAQLRAKYTALHLDQLAREFNARPFAVRARTIRDYLELGERKANGESLAAGEESFLRHALPAGLRFETQRAIMLRADRD